MSPLKGHVIFARALGCSVFESVFSASRVVLLLGAWGGLGMFVLALGLLSDCSCGFAFWGVGGFGLAVLASGGCALWWLCFGRL